MNKEKKVPQVENIKLKAVFTDKRGSIYDLVEEKVGHVGIVTFKKGVVRGNHYHKKSIQYSYVLSGKIKLVTSNKDGSNKKTRLLSPGTLTSIPAQIVHTYIAQTDASIIDITTMSRVNDGYERDTVKIVI